MMASRHDRLGRPGEETALLQGKTKIPVPWGQLSLAYLVLFSETISSEYMAPFINKVG